MVRADLHVMCLVFLVVGELLGVGVSAATICFNLTNQTQCASVGGCNWRNCPGTCLSSSQFCANFTWCPSVPTCECPAVTAENCSRYYSVGPVGRAIYNTTEECEVQWGRGERT